MRLYNSPFVHFIGQLHPSLINLLLSPNARMSDGELCSYGLGRRRQHQEAVTTDGSEPPHPLAAHPALRTFVINYAQQALGCDLTGQAITIHVRRCLDESSYFLSPHEDCPKTISALLVYLWHGERGTSLYRLSQHHDQPPAPEPGLRERVNNFHGHAEYQRANLDVITQLTPECFATYEHVKLIRPRLGSFLFIPNTRFRGALPDLPRSHHGVASQASDLDTPERRHLLLIDVKQSDAARPSLRSRLKARLLRPFRSRPVIQ